MVTNGKCIVNRSTHPSRASSKRATIGALWKDERNIGAAQPDPGLGACSNEFCHFCGKNVLGVYQLAELFNCSTAKINRLARRGDLPAFKFGKTWFVREQDLELYMTQAVGLSPFFLANRKGTDNTLSHWLDKLVSVISDCVAGQKSSRKLLGAKSWPLRGDLVAYEPRFSKQNSRKIKDLYRHLAKSGDAATHTPFASTTASSRAERGGKVVNSLRTVGQPGLFDDICEGANEDAAVNTSRSAERKNTPALRTETSPISSGPRLSEDQSRAEDSGPKRRKTYQYGTLGKPETRKKGPSVWPYRYYETVDGKRIRRKAYVGNIVEYPTRPDALRACEHLRMQANAENPLSNATMRGLIGRLSEEVLGPCLDVPVGGEVDEDAEREYSTASNYKSSLKCYILPKWGNYRVRDFEKPEIQSSVENWFRSLRLSKKNPDGLSGNSLKQIYGTMSILFSYGVKWGYLKFHPFREKRVQLPRGCSKRMKTPIKLTPGEFLSLMSYLDLREELAVKLGGWLGLRVSEPFGLKWEDVDFEIGAVTFKRGFVQARFSRLKTEPSRGKFSVPGEVIELLRRWHKTTIYNRPSDFVFASSYNKGRRPLCPKTLMSKIRPVACALGLPHIGWHTLRHSFNRWAKDTGLKVDDLKTLMRHETAKMALDVYGGPDLATSKRLQGRVMKYFKREAKKEASKSKTTENGLRLLTPVTLI